MKIFFTKNQKGLAHRSTTEGFTILETLVAISILILALTAAFSVAQNGLSLSISARDEVTAYYLAQEGVEFIRNLRDENSLNEAGWLTGISGDPGDDCYFGNYCAIDSPNKNIDPCGSAAVDCPMLKQDTSQQSVSYGAYGLASGWSTTQFRRSLLFKEISPDEVALTVIVSWTKGVNTRQFVVHENLFNWQR